MHSQAKLKLLEIDDVNGKERLNVSDDLFVNTIGPAASAVAKPPRFFAITNSK